MEDILLTIAELATAFAGFASIVVIFRGRQRIDTDRDLKITFQSMLLSALFVVFFSLLPIVISQFGIGKEHSYEICSAALLLYIMIAYTGALVFLSRGRFLKISGQTLVFLLFATSIVVSQALVQLGVVHPAPYYLAGVFLLLMASGFAFYSLITFPENTGDET